MVVVGSGARFLSGISHYTARLAAAMAATRPTTVVLMRALIPRWAYPGRDRVGQALSSMDYGSARVVAGVDWYWVPSIGRALSAVWRSPGATYIFQWWTGAVLHTYVLLAALARVRGGTVVVEFHEVQDTGEAAIPFVRSYTHLGMRALMRLTDAVVVHSNADREPVQLRYALHGTPVVVIPLGPFDHYVRTDARQPLREAPANVVNVLFFGTIRPYKGLEDLVRAFDALDEADAAGLWLTVVGETWEGWTLPLELIARSRHGDRITLVNRYVTDDEAVRWFSGADAVALPYHRSSASGPLQIAMSRGLPTIVTAVGGLEEAAGDYEGAMFVPPADVPALQRALLGVATRTGRSYRDPHSWERSVALYDELFSRLWSGPRFQDT